MKNKDLIKLLRTHPCNAIIRIEIWDGENEFFAYCDNLMVSSVLPHDGETKLIKIHPVDEFSTKEKNID